MLGRMVFAVVLALPLIEIALFIVIGQAIGVVPTLLGVLIAGIAGMLVIRWQGMAALGRLQTTLQRGELPAKQMGDAMLIGLGGVLLLIPGYFSDLIGILLLLPFVRHAIYALLARNFRVVTVAGEPVRPSDPELIELEPDDWRSR
ncbi:MAG: FxsA family protein [Devosia sp.]